MPRGRRTRVLAVLAGSWAVAFGVLALRLGPHLPPAANGLTPAATAEVADDLAVAAALHAGAPAPPARS
jgi:hypothetical protein